jgi:hypothetical protein
MRKFESSVIEISFNNDIKISFVLTESGRVPALNVPDKKILTTVTM